MTEQLILLIAKANTGIYRPENKEAELDISDYTLAQLQPILDIQKMLNRPWMWKRRRVNGCGSLAVGTECGMVKQQKARGVATTEVGRATERYKTQAPIPQT
jgi:hypothetical protein